MEHVGTFGSGFLTVGSVLSMFIWTCLQTLSQHSFSMWDSWWWRKLWQGQWRKGWCIPAHSMYSLMGRTLTGLLFIVGNLYWATKLWTAYALLGVISRDITIVPWKSETQSASLPHLQCLKRLCNCFVMFVVVCIIVYRAVISCVFADI